MNESTQIQNIVFQLKSLEIQFENINLQIQNMGIQNLGTQILNSGIQILNMGIQILNIAKEMPINGLEIPNFSQQIQNMGIQIQNIGMNINLQKSIQMNMNIPNPNMMQIMQMHMMKNMMNNNMENELNNLELIFEEKDTMRNFGVSISPSKKFQEAINLYRKKSESNKDMFFLFNGQILNPELTISQLGLVINSIIYVIPKHDVMGG